MNGSNDQSYFLRTLNFFFFYNKTNIFLVKSLTPFTWQIVALNIDTIALFTTRDTCSMSNFSYNLYVNGLLKSMGMHVTQFYLSQPPSAPCYLEKKKKSHLKLPLTPPLYFLINKMVEPTPRNPLVAVVGGGVAITSVKFIKPESEINYTICDLYFARLCVGYLKKNVTMSFSEYI